MAGTSVRLKQGTEIHTGKPFAFVVGSKHKNDRCDNCTKSGQLFKCSGCEYIYYCNRNCQRESWSIHKFECANLKRISPKVLPDMARLMARIIIKLNQGGSEERDFYTDTSYRKFKDLMSHYSDIKKDEKRMEHFTSLCVVLFNFLQDIPMPNTAELLGIYGRICINSFNISDNDMNSIGSAIYLGPSILNHSCKPNAVAVFEGTTIIVRTIEDMPSLDWSQVKLSYIDVLNSTYERVKELQEGYYFLCDCGRCKSPRPEESAAACQDTSCSFPCKSETTECPVCSAKFPPNFKETFDEVSELTAHHLQSMKNISYLDVCKYCLTKQEGVLHPYNFQHIKTLQAAFEAAIGLQVWNDAKYYAKKLLPGYKFYYGHVHPLTGLLYMFTGKILVHLEESKEALFALKTAKEILSTTHGERHSIVRECLMPILQQATIEAHSQ